MSKLINLNVIPAHGVICAWDYDDNNKDIDCGIALETARLNYMIPTHIAIGIFDDGTTRAGGLLGLNHINGNGIGTPLFLYDRFLEFVTLDYAKAFVRGLIAFGAYDNDAEAKESIYQELKECGIRISDKAISYFLS